MKNYNEKMTDKECLEAMCSFFPRVRLETELLTSDDGLVVAKVLYISCGDYILASEPVPIDPPLMALISVTETKH